MKRKCLIIGLDGGTLDILSPLMARGLLPNLAEIAGHGVSGKLRTIIPPITGPAWSSFMTGKNPGKHSVFEFVKRAPDGSYYPISSSEVDGKMIWELVSDAGGKVIVVNVPVTYPPRKVNGILIGDFLTPKGRGDFAYPARILPELEERFGPYRLYFNKVYAKGRVGDVLKELHETLDFRLNSSLYLMREYEWDFCMVHIFGTDRLQHELWHLLDPEHPSVDPGEYAEFHGQAISYLQEVDKAVGGLVKEAGEGADVLIMSDHGFGPIDKFFSLNVWLLDNGYIKLKKNPVTVLKSVLYRLGFAPANIYKIVIALGLANLRKTLRSSEHLKDRFQFINKIFLSFEDVDWSRSMAYSKGNYGQIFINDKYEWPDDPEEQGRQKERLLGELAAKLAGITDPETGTKVVREIYRKEELYHGRHTPDAPDLTFLTADMRYKALGVLDFTSNRFLESAFGNTGDHRMDGILFVRSHALRKGAAVDGAGIMDVAPTALYLMGLEVPDDMDGRVLTGLIDEGYLAENPVGYTRAESGDDLDGSGFSKEESEEVIERLKGLGYV